jgi:hypothetical protein
VFYISVNLLYPLPGPIVNAKGNFWLYVKKWLHWSLEIPLTPFKRILIFFTNASVLFLLIIILLMPNWFLKWKLLNIILLLFLTMPLSLDIQLSPQPKYSGLWRFNTLLLSDQKFNKLIIRNNLTSVELKAVIVNSPPILDGIRQTVKKILFPVHRSNNAQHHYERHDFPRSVEQYKDSVCVCVSVCGGGNLFCSSAVSDFLLFGRTRFLAGLWC